MIVEAGDHLPGDARTTALAVTNEVAALNRAATGEPWQPGFLGSRGSPRQIRIVERGARFVMVGGTSAVVQLSLLALFLRLGWQPIPADAVAVVAATELNFLLSSFVTWQDRWTSGGWSVRWLLFHASTGSMMLVNLLVFLGAHLMVHPLLASAAGIGVAGTGNFVLANRVVFRRVSA